MQTILIVEDDVSLCRGVKLHLEEKGFLVQCAYSIQEACRVADDEGETISLMLLDCNLPDGDGMEFCKDFRRRHTVPVIFLTARDTEEDMILGFQAGADDYMAKPFSVELLYERISAVLRRSAGEKDREVFCYRGLTVDLGKMQVFREGEQVKLSGTEYRILELLIRNRSQVMTREMLLQKIWDFEENYVDENTLNVYIRRLRQKLEKDPAAQFDADWTAEAVFNLLDNAVKYSEKAEKKEIILSVRKLGLFAEISVEDHNGAISQEEQNRIFRRFYRGENSTGKEGIGLGLYLTREIALRLGGYVSVKATERGNIFSIYLRL